MSPLRMNERHSNVLLSWYFVCSSSSLERGKIMSFEIPGADIIVFRGSSGEARALGAHCPHMGTHLGKGCVIGDQVRCPMHHWRYDGDGNCHKHESATAAVSDFKLTAYPLAESYGAIFVFNATEALFPPPEFESGGTNDIATRAGKPVFLDCPWEAVAANGFDRQHFETVHERALRNEPELTRPTPYLLRLHYTSRVTGRTIVDRTMKWLSRDHINVRITCWGGTNVLVESDLGRTRSALILCLVPTKEATTVTPLFGVYQSRFHWIDKLRLNLAAWLFGGFLRRDVAIMNGMRF
ncbi:Rieske 2Fe-2S domain-containing protein, partial [Candidatus Sumerlaeota bacterium]|nr:Rieske 2Fe-2S domain-containing protein [Candidatus Sumerlaeota bacterium]